MFEYLLDEGVNAEALQRVHAPCGLDLGGTTPEEIALSVISEIVQRRRGGSGGSLMVNKAVQAPTC